MNRPIDIEVCERLMDRQPGGGPKYHAQIKGDPDLWAAGTSINDAIGNLMRTRPKRFGMEIKLLTGKLAR